MKKLFSLAIAMFMLFALVACNNDDMQSKIDQMEARLQTQTDKIAELEQSKVQLTDEISKLEQTVDDFTERNQELLEQIADLENDLGKLQQELEKFEQEIEMVTFVNWEKPWENSGYNDTNIFSSSCGIEEAMFYYVTYNGGMALPIVHESTIKECPPIGDGVALQWDGYYYPGYAEHDYIDAIIKLEDKIIGYVVIEINLLEINENGARIYTAEVLKSVLFAQIDGEHIDVSEEYVRYRIELAKNK